MTLSIQPVHGQKNGEGMIDDQVARLLTLQVFLG